MVLTFELFSFDYCLSHHGRGSGTLVLPVGRKLTSGTVVPGKPVDTTLDKNQTELGILILTIALQVLTDGNGLLDQHVKILRNFRGESVGLENTDNLLASDRGHLGDTVRVTKNHTNLGRGKTLLGELADVLLNIRGGDLAPAWWGAFVGLGTLRDAFAWSMHSSHAVNEKQKSKRSEK